MQFQFHQCGIGLLSILEVDGRAFAVMGCGMILIYSDNHTRGDPIRVRFLERL